MSQTENTKRYLSNHPEKKKEFNRRRNEIQKEIRRITKAYTLSLTPEELLRKIANGKTRMPSKKPR